MKHKWMLAGALLVLGLGGMASADDETYTLNVSRLTGAVDCTVTDPTTDKAAFECTLKLKGNKTVGLEMKKAPGRLLTVEQGQGFYGMDLFEEGTVAKRFIVVADKTKAIKFVSFADMAQSQPGDIRVNVAGSAASAVKAVSINPLHIQVSEDKSKVKIGVWFTLYSQDAGLLWNAERGIVPSDVMSQIEAQLFHALAN